VAESQQVIGNVCLGGRTLDQESPGSSPGGAIKPGNGLGHVGLFLSAKRLRSTLRLPDQLG
jgi:hypothetical protein